MPTDISHNNLLKTLRSYLSTRKRKVPTDLKGICNGASLILSTDVYEALNGYYKNPKSQDIEILHEKIKEAVDNYFKRIEVLINRSNPTVENDPTIKKKSQLLNTKAWYEADHKLQDAINKKILNISGIDKSLPRYEEILRLAQNQNILTLEETNLLRDAHIEDIPEYENFLNEAILLQFSLEYLHDAPQTALPKLFPLLQRNDSIPSPIMEEGVSLVLTPLELAEYSSKIIPENRPVLLHLPEHATFVVRVGNEYQFYDINNKERLPFTDAPEVMVCLFSKHNIQLQIDNLKNDFLNNIMKISELKNQIKKIDELQKKILEEKNRDKRISLIKNNQDILLPYLGFSLSIYSYPSQPRLSKEWHQSMIKLQSKDFDRRDSQGETVLWKACAYGHIELVKHLLEKGISPNTKRGDGATAFYVACQNGYFEILELLKSHGVDVDIANDNGRTALYAAALEGNYAAAKWLLQHNANTELGMKSKDENKITTSLIAASASGHADVVQLLIDYGAEKKQDALFQAAIFGHGNVIRTLIKNGFDVNVRDSEGNTPLMYAAVHGHIEAMRALVDNGADVNVVRNDGATAFLAAVFEGHVKAIEFLYQHNAKIDVKDAEGDNALHLVCQSGHPVIVEYLLSKNFDSNEVNKQGVTPLMLASYCGHTDVVGILLNCSQTDINYISKNLITTAFHLAVQQDKIDVVIQLCNAGANVNLQNDEHQTPLDMAIKEGKAEIAFALLQYGAVCNLKPEVYKLPDYNDTQEQPKVIMMSLSQEQKLLNMYIEEFPSLLTDGQTLAEKIGLIFKEIIVTPNMGLFDKKMLSIHQEARIICNTLLDPNNKNWSPAEIAKLLLNNTPEKQEKDFKLSMLLAKYLLSTVVDTQKIVDNLSPSKLRNQ